MPRPAFKKMSTDVDCQQASFSHYVQAHCDSLVTPAQELPLHESVIQEVLSAYQELADRFYSRFRRDLERAYAVQKTVKAEEVPLRLQQALDKLINEWLRVDGIAHSSQSLSADTDLLKAINLAVALAAHDLGIDQKIIVVPGEAFSLCFFTYLADVAILTVPIYSIRAPWEWSIFWHELAGFKVRRLRKSTEIGAIGKNLEFLHQILTDPQFNNPRLHRFQDELLAAMTRHNPFGVCYLKNCLTKSTPDLSDFGSFERQLEWMFTRLAANELKSYERAKLQGWCTGWMKELFEDAWSVTAFGSKFLGTFENILRRHGIQDYRHPPLEVRLAVARNLLELQSLAKSTTTELDVALDARRMQLQKRLALASEEKLKDIRRDVLAAELAAQQTFKFMSLLVPTTLPFAEPRWNVLIQAGNYQKLKQEIHRRIKAGDDIKFTQSDQSDALETAARRFKAAMLNAMQAQAQFHSKNDPVIEASKYADNLIETVLARIKVHLEYPELGLRRESFNILRRKDFRQMLEVEFYDGDLFDSGYTQPQGEWHPPQPVQPDPWWQPTGTQSPYGVASAASYSQGMGPH